MYMDFLRKGRACTLESLVNILPLNLCHSIMTISCVAVIHYNKPENNNLKKHEHTSKQKPILFILLLIQFRVK